MGIFVETLKINLKVYFYYKWNFIIPLLFDPIIVFFYNSLLKTIYSGQQGMLLLGYSLSQMIWYFAATKFFYSLIWSLPDINLSQNIIRGELIVWFVKPVSIPVLELSKAVANKICSFILEFIPSFIIFTMIVYPDFLTPVSLLKYIVLIFFAFLLFYFMSFFIGTIAFSWKSIQSLTIFKTILIYIGAGTFIPLEFYPDFLQKLIKFLPFQYLHYVPIHYFLNMSQIQTPYSFGKTLTIMIFWIMVFVIASKISWKVNIRRYTVAGG